ncbi:FkbM family methyltransferase [bacterium]|nr:FkbM family methyltransferase [bacterium]
MDAVPTETGPAETKTTETGSAAPAVDTREKKAAALIRRARRNQRKAWAEGYLKGICTLLRPGDLAVDLGANMGVVTEQLAATGADVVAFEPDPLTFARLQDRFAGRQNITLVHAAVGVGAGTVRLMRANNFAENPEGASVKSTILDGGRRIDAENAVDVPLIDFPSWVREQVAARGKIAFIKMDIEGAELDILEAMDREGLFADILGLVAETHERKFKDLRDRFRALKAAIAEHEPSGKINLDWI